MVSNRFGCMVRFKDGLRCRGRANSVITDLATEIN